jgi:hypothetical protein
MNDMKRTGMLKINHLAKWMHETSIRLDPEAKIYPTWNRLSSTSRDRYRRLARELLENPPAVLREAVEKKARKERV